MSIRPWSSPDWADHAGARATARAPAIAATAAKERAVIPSGVSAVVCGWGKSDRHQIAPKLQGGRCPITACRRFKALAISSHRDLKDCIRFIHHQDEQGLWASSGQSSGPLQR
jgi:hypothetical protein